MKGFKFRAILILERPFKMNRSINVKPKKNFPYCSLIEIFFKKKNFSRIQ